MIESLPCINTILLSQYMHERDADDAQDAHETASADELMDCPITGDDVYELCESMTLRCSGSEGCDEIAALLMSGDAKALMIYMIERVRDDMRDRAIFNAKKMVVKK